MVWKLMKNLIRFLITSYEQSNCTCSEGKQNVYIFIQVSKQRKRKKIKKRGCRALYLGPSKIFMIGRQCENTTVKGYIINVWYDFKHTPEVAQDSKINLKWINTKILEKTVHFFNVDLAEDILHRDIPRFQ